jgi:hypothetical protein
MNAKCLTGAALEGVNESSVTLGTANCILETIFVVRRTNPAQRCPMLEVWRLLSPTTAGFLLNG